jgi:hypothetical protein
MKSMPTTTNTGNRQSSAMITLYPRILCVLPLNTLGKQYNECSLKYALMDREKIGRCHTLESKK